MKSLIPDTLQGALILSLIDFLLSFLVISFIGVVLTGFPLLNRVAAWLASRRPKVIVSAVASQPAPIADQDIPEEDIAAIVAAISAMIGEHRILRIEPSQYGAGWLAAGRQAQHQSHQPQRNPMR
ncbi:MAG: hypothetical protein P4L87_01845 [Formivibrio sp.]|nr:hypothetical protein [Formivibrio sp.]